MSSHLDLWLTGSFYAATEEDSIVIALATDKEDKVLITGDSKGYISLWDIGNYCIRKREATVIAKVGETLKAI